MKPPGAPHTSVLLALLVSTAPGPSRAAEPPAASVPTATAISLAPRYGERDAWFFKEVDLPPGKVRHAWTMISAGQEYVLTINGAEASRSRYGRVASAFRLAEEVEDIGPYLRPGARNRLLFRVHVWSLGTKESPTVPYVRMEGTVEMEGPREGAAALERGPIPLVTDGSWVGAHAGPRGSEPGPPGATPVHPHPDPGFGRLPPRIPRDRRREIAPDLPPPLPSAVLRALPRIAEMSDWSQQVVFRDPAVEAERLLGLFPSLPVAERYARAISSPPTHMGDSYSINAVSVGNGWVWTAIGSYPFHDIGVVAGPEYQYPVQWNPGSTFLGDNLRILVDGREVRLPNQWLWKVRKTDVVVTAETDAKREVAFYTLTFAPPDLKALLRIFAVSNGSRAPLRSFQVLWTIPRSRESGKTLVDSVKHEEMKAGSANVRGMVAGVLDETGVTAVETPASDGASKQGALEIDFGEVGPGEFEERLAYRVTYLESVGGKPVASDAGETLERIRARGRALLDDTIEWGRRYNEATTCLEAPGPWGKRVADFIDDSKMLVQTQQFARTGAVGPMWFFSDQWIRDACGPIRSFLRTGAAESARRAIDYFYTASVANRIILNWVGMDVDVEKAWPPVTDWSDISVHAGGGDHVSAEVPSWLILQHHWYWKSTGDAAPIREHWGYLRRLYFGQFDNKRDGIFRPDFKIPFHGDETYIYSGGEALWENRYDLRQSSYPGGNIHSADSSFELVAAGDALIEMGRAAGKDVSDIERVNPRIREATERYYWMEDLGFYAQGMSVLQDGQLNRFPMANIAANVIWCGYGDPGDRKTVSNALRMAEYLAEDTGVFDPIVGYDVTVGMLQGQCLHTLAAIKHPWAEKAFHALLMIAGDTAEYSEWMAPGPDFRTMYRANRLRPWEGGINLDAALYYLTGLEPDAPAKALTLTPRLPGGVYSPIRWDSMTLRELPLGSERLTLRVADEAEGRRRYELSGSRRERLAVTLNCLVPLARIAGIELDGKAVDVTPTEVFGQGLATVRASLEPGRTLTVVARWEPTGAKPVAIEPREFRPPEPRFEESDVVVFSAERSPPTGGSGGGRKTLDAELAKRHRVVALDASLPTDPGTFRGALLTEHGLKSRMLILGAGALANRKESFWWDASFDRTIGEFLRRGGAVLEAGSGLTSSRWLEGALAPAAFQVDAAQTGHAVALDSPDESLDRQHRWLQEMNVGQAGKWSAYWEGWFDFPYREGGASIRDHFFVWGEQEQPHGAMQFTMRSVPGKDHLIRVRTTAGTPRRGLTLQATEDKGATWTDIETVWFPAPEAKKPGGWLDVYLTLPAKYVTEESVTFRLKAPRGSFGGIGYEPERLASTGAARIWIRDGLERPPATKDIATTSTLAARFALPSRGLVAYAQGRIRFSGFACPYRILGESAAGALILKRVGKGLYVRSEVAVETSFPVDRMVEFVEALLDPKAREAVPDP